MQGSDLAIQQGAVFHENHARAAIDVKVLQSETEREPVEWLDRRPSRLQTSSVQVTHMLSGRSLYLMLPRSIVSGSSAWERKNRVSDVL